jgi:hypothetical protein
MTIRLRPAQPWHIQVAPYRDGWIVGEAALDNAQFFHARADAEAAASNLGERLGHAGDFCGCCQSNGNLSPLTRS